MQKHSLQRPRGNMKKTRVGRGGKRGKTSGRGTKGQKARAGNSMRPEMRDIIKKYPKRRGYGKNRARTVVPRPPFQVVNLDQVSAHFAAGEEVSPKTLLDRGLVRRTGGRLPRVKVLSRGALKHGVSFRGVGFSKTAREAIGKAGGTMTA